MSEPDNFVLEHLPAIRGEISKLADSMRLMQVEMTAMRQHLSGIVTIQEHDHGDIAVIKARLDRIEQRLTLAE